MNYSTIKPSDFMDLTKIFQKGEGKYSFANDPESRLFGIIEMGGNFNQYICGYDDFSDQQREEINELLSKR